MQTAQEISEVLNVAAQACGPVVEPPAYVRLPFPINALPGVLKRFVEAASKALGVPPEVVATPALGTCAAAIGNTCRVRIDATWTEPAILWAVTLLESGSLKTPAYNLAVEPLREAQRKLEVRFQDDLAAYKVALRAYEDGKANGQQGDSVAPVEPQAPKPTDLFTSDSTVEALAMLFANNPRGLAFTRDELSGFFGSFGAYKGGRGADESAYLEFYNAGLVKLNRASGKRIYVECAGLSIFGTCQPSVFLKAIGADGRGSQNQVENGLAARFIATAPKTAAKRWRGVMHMENDEYKAMVRELLTIPMLENAEGKPEPVIIHMTPKALEVFAQFVNEHGRVVVSIENPALRYHFAKLEAVAVRLGLIFCMVETASQDRTGTFGVNEKHIMAGILIARWFGREAQRIYAFYESEEARDQRELLDVIRDHGGTITPKEMSRHRRKWCDPLAAELALRSLARQSFGELALDQPGSQGGRPTLRFRLHEYSAVGETPGKSNFAGVSTTGGGGDV